MSEEKIRDVVFPIIKATKASNGLKFEDLLGTGFLIEGKGNIGMTSFDVIKNTPVENIYCMFVINNKWVGLNIKHVQRHEHLNIAAFSVPNAPESWVTITSEEHYSSCNFMLWGYPNEYLNEIEPGQRPDLGYHQGYVIRRLTGIPNLPQGNKLFEVNVPFLSEGYYGAPLISNRQGIWQLIGIYVGTREFILDQEYVALKKLINSNESNNFWNKLKSENKEYGLIDILENLGQLGTIIANKSFTGFILSFIKQHQNKQVMKQITDQNVKDKDRINDILEKLHNFIHKEPTVSYGLAVRTSELKAWISSIRGKLIA